VASNITQEFKKYFEDLTATNSIVDDFGTTFTFGTNLFIGTELGVDRNCLTIIPTSGGAPSAEGDRHYTSVIIRIKHSSNASSLETTQSIINLLHNNTDICASKSGRVKSSQSSPIIIGYLESGEYCVTAANFDITHIKL